MDSESPDVAQVPKSVPSPKASPVEKKLTKEKRAKKFNINVKTLAKDCIVVSIQLSDTFAVVKQKIVDEIERVAKEKERELLKELEKKSKSTRNRKEDASSLETLQLQQLPQAGEEFSDFRLAFDGKELEDQQTVDSIEAFTKDSTLEMLPAEPRSGSSRFVFPSGAVYTGQWKLFLERGPLGELARRKKRHGMGRFTHGGEVYDGEWTDDKMTGHGIFRFASGAQYEGQWQNGKFHGRGTYTWSSGARYVGDWAENRMHGSGCFVAQSNDRFQGMFHNNRFQNSEGHWIAPDVAESVKLEP